MAISKIKSLVFKREFVKDGKTSYIYKMELEDGVVGDFFSPDDPIKKQVGETLEYNYNPNPNPQYLGSIKEIKPAAQKQGGGGYRSNPQAENAKTALSLAVQIYIASNFTDKDKISNTANTFFDWLQSKA